MLKANLIGFLHVFVILFKLGKKYDFLPELILALVRSWNFFKICPMSAFTSSMLKALFFM